MKWSLFFKALFFFNFILSWTFGSFSAFAYENLSSRSLRIWDKNIDYQLEIKNDPQWPSDGESFKKLIKGRPIYHVVINRAFYQKEAEQLFRQFEQVPKNQFTDKQFDFPEWRHFEKNLLSLRESSFKEKKSQVKSTLKALKGKLEYLAWFKVYEKSVKESVSKEEAQRKFTQQFSQIRDKIIEYHEVAHVIDLMKVSVEESHSAEFERYTELNAFYTELAYSENPYDTMAHAVVGLLDEIDQAKTTDYSIEKVSTLLRFLKECPRFAELFRPGNRMALCCFEVLAKINSMDFVFVGNELYRRNLSSLRQKLASLSEIGSRLSS